MDGAMWSLAVITVARCLVGVVSQQVRARRRRRRWVCPWQAVQDAIEDRSYLLLHAGSLRADSTLRFS